MATIDVRACILVQRPSGGGEDAYRWRATVYDEEDEADGDWIMVKVTDTAATSMGLGESELTRRVPDALRRYARSVLTNDEPVIHQVKNWDSPITLRPDHFA